MKVQTRQCEGGDRAKLEKMVAALGLDAQVALVGFVENPYPFMSAAAVVVSTSRYEGLPNVLIEAIALGTPVVATDCPSGPREILLNGELGPLCPIGDPVAIAAGIMSALSNPVSSADLMDRSKAYSLENASRHYLSVLIR